MRLLASWMLAATLPPVESAEAEARDCEGVLPCNPRFAVLPAAPEVAAGGCLTPCEVDCVGDAAELEETAGQGALATTAEGARAVGGPLGNLKAAAGEKLSFSCACFIF